MKALEGTQKKGIFFPFNGEKKGSSIVYEPAKFALKREDQPAEKEGEGGKGAKGRSRLGNPH